MGLDDVSVSTEERAGYLFLNDAVGAMLETIVAELAIGLSLRELLLGLSPAVLGGQQLLCGGTCSRGNEAAPAIAAGNVGSLVSRSEFASVLSLTSAASSEISVCA